MRKHFHARYRPSEEAFRQLWQTCIFVFDTNVLLNLYRYTPETYEKFMGILQQIRARIWIPYQVAAEFHENRIPVITQQTKFYGELLKSLDKQLAEVNRLAEEHARHPSAQRLASALEGIKAAITTACEQVEAVRRAHPDLLREDPILEAITDLFDEHMGEPYTPERLKAAHAEAADRFAKGVPPGTKDASKGGERQYGDVVVWLQTIDYAHTQKTPIIFVTDDKKEDWWQVVSGETIGPRPELLTEFRERSGQLIYFYKPDQFMTYAGAYLDAATTAAAIEEVREVSEQVDLEIDAATYLNAMGEVTPDALDPRWMGHAERIEYERSRAGQALRRERDLREAMVQAEQRAWPLRDPQVGALAEAFQGAAVLEAARIGQGMPLADLAAAAGLSAPALDALRTAQEAWLAELASAAGLNATLQEAARAAQVFRPPEWAGISDLLKHVQAPTVGELLAASEAARQAARTAGQAPRASDPAPTTSDDEPRADEAGKAE